MTLFLLATLPASIFVTWFSTWLLNCRFRKVSVDDPSLPEKLQIHRRNVWMAIFFTLFLSALAIAFAEKLQGSDIKISSPIAFSLIVIWLSLLGIAAGIAGYPNRIRIFEESWSLGKYLSFNLRLAMAFSGFWIMGLIVPPILFQIGIWGIVIGLPLGLILLNWSLNFPKWFCWWMQTDYLDNDSEHFNEFQKVIDRSSVKKISIQISGPQQGHWVNAIALPSLSNPTIVMSKPLLEKLSLKEATAIFAHELAHIEDFSEGWLRRSRLADIFMVMVGFLVFPVLSAVAGESFQWMPWIWFGLLVTMYITKVKGMQNREVFADTRGLELSPDLDAFIAGLTKVYTHARIPRRVQFEVDQHTSHPSLARRIQQLKSHAESIGLVKKQVPASLTDIENDTVSLKDTHAFFQSTENSNEFLLFETNHLVRITTDIDSDVDETDVTEDWIRSNKSIEQSISYSGLLELRLIYKSKKPLVRTVEAPKIIRQFSLKTEDIERLTKVLNKVDTQITPLKNISLKSQGARLATLGAAVVLVFALTQGVASLGAVTFFLVGALATMAKTTRVWVAAMGGAAGFYALRQLLFAGDQSWWSETAWMLLGTTAVLGIVNWIQVFKKNTKGEKYLLDEGQALQTGAIILGIGFIFTLPLFLSIQGGNSLSKLSMLATNSHLAFIPFLCAGCAWFVSRKAVLKSLGLIMLAAGLSPAYLSSEYFKSQFAGEVLSGSQAQFPDWQKVDYNTDHTIKLEKDHWGLQLAPNGEWVITETENNSESDNNAYQLSNWQGDTITIEAKAAIWKQDSQVLILEENGSDLELVSFYPESRETKTTHFIRENPNIKDDFEIQSQGEHWQLITGKSKRLTTRIRGQFGSDKTESQTWYNDDFEDTWRHPIKNGQLVELSWNRNQDDSNPLAFQKLHTFYYWPTNIRLLSPEGKTHEMVESNLWVTANSDIHDNLRILSQSHTGASLWSVDNQTTTLVPEVRLPKIQNWWIQEDKIVILGDQSLYLLNLDSNSGVEIPLAESTTWEVEASLRGKMIAMMWRDGSGEKIECLTLNEASLPESYFVASHLSE